MLKKMKKFLSIVCLFVCFSSLGQVDTLFVETKQNVIQSTKFNSKQLIAPLVLISAGAIGRNLDEVKKLNEEIRNRVITNGHGKLPIDDVLQYVPVSQVFLLSNLGVTPRHNIKERLLLGATAYIVMATMVNTIKHTTRVLRPDNSALNSFPSGHTATAFTGLELLWQEYKDISVWVGITGYSMAIATASLRVYNNKHWLTDVLTGAGVGILSAKVAYWLLPITSKWVGLSSQDKKTNIVAYPILGNEMKGVGVAFSF